jgi:hypothetical protein
LPAAIDLIFTKTPSLLTVALSALRGYRFTLDPAKAFPVITARRDAIKPDAERLADFARICGLDIGDRLPLIYPLTFIYPLVQIMLARPEAPLSLLKTLNTRIQYELDIAFKGPVYYGNDVILKSRENAQGERFDIYSEANPRPGICGNLQFG